MIAIVVLTIVIGCTQAGPLPGVNIAETLAAAEAAAQIAAAAGGANTPEGKSALSRLFNFTQNMSLPPNSVMDIFSGLQAIAASMPSEAAAAALSSVASGGLLSPTSSSGELQETSCSNKLMPNGRIFQLFITRFSDAGLTERNTENDLSWQDARLACQGMGGDLAWTSTREEQDQLMAAFDQLGGLATYYNYWIGVEKQGLNINWVTRDTIKLVEEKLVSELKFQKDINWDNYGGLGCGTINGDGIFFPLCSKGSAAGYVCEFPNASIRIVN